MVYNLIIYKIVLESSLVKAMKELDKVLKFEDIVGCPSLISSTHEFLLYFVVNCFIDRSRFSKMYIYIYINKIL